MRKIVAEVYRSPRPSQQSVEVVERKGKGHPDSICDSVAEAVSQALSREYMQRFGRILHHNVDKGILIAGQVEHAFGGGRVVKPMRLIIGDRATEQFEGERVDVHGIAVQAASRWIRSNFRFLDPDIHMVIESALAPGSPELTRAYFETSGPLPANDTSAAVGYYPPTDTERLVALVEWFLSSHQFKADFPDTGEDIKVMGFRVEDRLDITVAMPLMETMIPNETAYFVRKSEILDRLTAYLTRDPGSELGSIRKVEISLNTLDEPGKGLSGVYVSLLGTSAEDADSGQVGRGNRVNGIIALARPSSAEAAPGKNPIGHVGKIYNVLAFKLAERIYREVEGMEEVWVWLCSRIGQPVDQPSVVAVQFVPGGGSDPARLARLATELVHVELDTIEQLCSDLALGKYPVA
jgi:S-adenosylmethionine synthetase